MLLEIYFIYFIRVNKSSSIVAFTQQIIAWVRPLPGSGRAFTQVPLTDYKRIGGSAFSGSSVWNLLRLFSPDRFDPIARLLGQISQWQWNITPDCRTQVWRVRLLPITSDYYLPTTQVLPLVWFSSNFPPDPPILWFVGHRDVSFNLGSNLEPNLVQVEHCFAVLN